MSEAAVAAAEEAMAAARLASIHTNSALAAAKLAMEQENRINRETSGGSDRQRETPVTGSETLLSATCDGAQRNGELQDQHSECSNETSKESLDDELNDIDIEDEESELDVDDENENTRNTGEPQKKKRNICDNCKRYRTLCLDGKFLLKVIKKTEGMKVVGLLGPEAARWGRVGTVVGGTTGNVKILWDSDCSDKLQWYSLRANGRFAFKFFCQQKNDPRMESPINNEREKVKSWYNETERKLFIGGLDISVTDDNLREYFAKFGKLTDSVVMMNEVSQTPRGYGFVTFQEPDMMKHCLDSQPHQLNGKVVELRRATHKEGKSGDGKAAKAPSLENPTGNNKLFVAGFDPSVTKEDLKEYFETFGKLSDWVVMIGHHGSKCCGFITFKSYLAMEKCLKSKPHYLKGKVLDLKPATTQYPKDFALERNFPNKWLFAHRLPFKAEGNQFWNHEAYGEKHRIRFCASENINVMGIGLLVKSVIKRVTLNICQESGRFSDEHCVIFMQYFDDVKASSSSSIVLKLRHGVELSCDKIYLMVLTLHGGASYIGVGGEEFVSVSCGPGEVKEVLFKFEDYNHRTDKPQKTTDLERGLVEKIYFEL